jgi:GntR family transcriptional regulator, trigonelline degradation regulator
MTNPSSSNSLGSAPLRIISKSAAPLRRQVVDELRGAIITGRLAPGARLVERELIAMLGVSRTVIREALRQLESEGLLAASNKGLVVRKLTSAEAKDLYSIRAVLEGLAARLFVENAAPEQLETLGAALGSMIAAYERGDPEQVLEAKNHFYDILFDGAASETLSTMISVLHARIWRWRALGLGHPQRSAVRSAESVKVLQALYEAIAARDADVAEKLAREDVTKAATEIMRLLEDQ